MKTPDVSVPLRRGLRRAQKLPVWQAANRTVRSVDQLTRRVPYPPAVKRVGAQLRLRPGVAVVPMDSLLLGGENAMSAADYARATGDLLRPSTPIARWPHVELLQDYVAHGESALEPESFGRSSYLANARRCVATTGHYFGATTDEEILAVAGGFVRRFEGAGGQPGSSRPSQSRPDEPIRVRPIRHSSCYEVVDGHHRLAARFVRGEPTAQVVVERRQVWTPLQSLLREMSWLDGRMQLYQPLSSPELDATWTQVRKCTDRMGRMREFLGERGLLSENGDRTYLDVACCYGWFLGQMRELGYDVHGIERDPLGAVLAEQAYGVESARITVGDCVPALEAAGATYDVVSCFSLLHHFVLGRGPSSPEHLAQLLDKVTGRVLFFDTGQGHEAWFKADLPGWDADFIEDWLRRNTSFDEIVRLGPDEDAVPPFEDNYGRMLFACVRHDR